MWVFGFWFWVFFLGTAEEREVRKKEGDDVKICQGKINQLFYATS